MKPVHIPVAVAISLCVMVGITGTVTPAQPVLSPEQQLAARGEGLVLARCAVCHSTDLIVQQRMERAKWDATITKMRHWGAEITDEEAELLGRYLSVRYAPTTPDVLPHDRESAVPYRADDESHPSVGQPVGNARRGAGLFSVNCQACHGTMAGGGAGPKLLGNPILGDDDRFWDTVLHGRGAMPAWGTVLKSQEIADIYAWLQSLKE